MRPARILRSNTGADPVFTPDKKQTKTPAFKRWFGKSKVVGPDRKPLVVYHGTRYVGRECFTVFDPSRSKENNGFFFTDDLEVAHTYGGAGFYPPRGNYDCGVYPVYLRMLNPLVVDAEGAYGFRLPLRIWTPEGELTSISTDNLARRVKEKGYYDGIIIKNVRDCSDYCRVATSTIYILFDPHNVKSALANVGTFALNDPDIRHNPVGKERVMRFVRLPRRRRNPRLSDPYEAVEAFMADWESNRLHDHLNENLGVYVVLEPYGRIVNIEWIMATRPKKGAGSKAMQFITDLADHYGVTLTLYAQPSEDDTMDLDALTSFYLRFGFEFDLDHEDEGMEGGEYMLRTPFPGEPDRPALPAPLPAPAPKRRKK